MHAMTTPARFTCIHTPVMPNEYDILLNIRAYLNGIGPASTAHCKPNPCKHLALVTGMGMTVAQEVLCLYKAKERPAPIKKFGWPKKILNNGFVSRIHEIILAG